LVDGLHTVFVEADFAGFIHFAVGFFAVCFGLLRKFVQHCEQTGDFRW
jgi:hypothetical protein